MKWDTLEPLTPFIHPHYFPSIFSFSKPLPSSYIALSHWINPPLSGQISDETEYTWQYLALTLYPDGHCQN